MWKVRTKFVTFITGALGIIKKGSDQNLHLLPGHPDHINEQCTHTSFVKCWAPGPVWTGEDNLAPTAIWNPNHPARSESLYELCYLIIIIIIIINNAYFENKTGSNAVTTHSDTKRNIPRGLFSPLLFCIALIPLTNELNRDDCGYQVHGTERKISHLLYTDDLKLLSRNENDLKYEMKIVQTVSKDMNMNFGLEKCTREYFKKR